MMDNPFEALLTEMRAIGNELAAMNEELQNQNKKLLQICEMLGIDSKVDALAVSAEEDAAQERRDNGQFGVGA